MENFENIGPKGYVILTDKSGNILREGSNMILKDGRDYLFSLLLSNNSSINTDKLDESEKTGFSSLSEYKFSTILFSKESTANYYSYTFRNNEQGGEYSYTLGEGSNLYVERVDNESINESDTRYRLRLVSTLIKKNAGDSDIFNSLMILLKKDNSDDKKIFSRFCFDPISIENDSEITLTYYIYF